MRDGAAAADVVLLPAGRRRVLDLLDPDTAVDARRVADALGLHVSTVRAHLEGLVADGLVVRERSAVGRVGRPRHLYRRAGHDDDGYRELAAALVHGLAGEPDGPALARRAGRSWSARVAPVSASASVRRGAAAGDTGEVDGGSAGAGAAEAVGEDVGEDVGEAAGEQWLAALVRGLDRVGFAPSVRRERDTSTGARVVEMRACPYLELAREHTDVTCSLHRGLVEGLLGDTAAATVDLRPFAGTTGDCLLLLHPTP